jgi:hypothetical protein
VIEGGQQGYIFKKKNTRSKENFREVTWREALAPSRPLALPHARMSWSKKPIKLNFKNALRELGLI